VLGSIGALVLQSLLIVGLLSQRRARRQAESDSRRNLALAADASRRQTMSALTNSMAHELGQPLSSMIHNAEALRAMVDADRATSDVAKEILTDIRTQGEQAAHIIERHRTMLRSHQLDRQPIDLHAVVHDSWALVAHDMKARQIEAAVVLSSHPCVVSGDPVLLQQVLVNLMMNAIDAMAEAPPTRRRLTITTAVRTADVELSVRDSGTGLPPEIDGTLFTPFVTTKPHGLGVGLTIVRTIVEAHGGAIDAHNSPDGGAIFTVTLPRTEIHGNRSASSGAA
jgi:signal transduction histidine kinase